MQGIKLIYSKPALRKSTDDSCSYCENGTAAGGMSGFGHIYCASGTDNNYGYSTGGCTSGNSNSINEPTEPIVINGDGCIPGSSNTDEFEENTCTNGANPATPGMTSCNSGGRPT